MAYDDVIDFELIKDVAKLLGLSSQHEDRKLRKFAPDDPRFSILLDHLEHELNEVQIISWNLAWNFNCYYAKYSRNTVCYSVDMDFGGMHYVVLQKFIDSNSEKIGTMLEYSMDCDGICYVKGKFEY